MESKTSYEDIMRWGTYRPHQLFSLSTRDPSPLSVTLSFLYRSVSYSTYHLSSRVSARFDYHSSDATFIRQTLFDSEDLRDLIVIEVVKWASEEWTIRVNWALDVEDVELVPQGDLGVLSVERAEREVWVTRGMKHDHEEFEAEAKR